MVTDDRFHTAIVVVFTIFYFVVFMSSIVGNSFVLWVCYKELKRRTSSLKWFIINLAVADLTFTLLTTLDLISFLWTWVGGQLSCKLESFLVEVCYTASIMTLVLISYERFKAVVVPFIARIAAPESARYKLIGVWVASLVLGSPALYGYGVEKENNGTVYCSNTEFGDLEREIYYGIHAVSFFLVPLIYMIYAQISIFLTLRSSVFSTQTVSVAAFSNRRMHCKVARTLAALTFAFVTCWTPFIVVRTLRYFNLTAVKGYIWKASQLLVLLNTALDPILYGLYGGNLKPFLQRLFKCENVRLSTRVENIAMEGTIRGAIRVPRRMFYFS